MRTFQKTHAIVSLWVFCGLFLIFAIFLVIFAFFRGADDSTFASNEIPLHYLELDENYVDQDTLPLEMGNVSEAVNMISQDETRSLFQGSCPAGTSNFTYTLFHVNSQISLGSYIPPRLVEIPASIETLYPPLCLQYEVAQQLLMMNDTINDAGHRLVVTSGFRDPWIQDILHAKSQKNSPTQSHASVAPPQHSEHQLGTTIDVTSFEKGGYVRRIDFENSTMYAWLSRHAHEYGFIQSYMQGQESVTGYIAEPWHFRYVGVSIATDVKKSELSLNEYLANDLFLENI